MKAPYFVLLSLLLGYSAIAQTDIKSKNTRIGKMYFYWGWNRGYYSQSDINFEGDNYDFTLNNVIAKDRQTKFTPDAFLNPVNMTIPQYNVRIGYYLTDKIDISIGIDHMKYVVEQYQIAKISGTISNTGTQYDGIYNNDDVVIKRGFLLFEHTDGLNYFNVDVRHLSELLSKNRFSINSIKGMGIGALVPRSNVKLLNNPREDTKIHLAGYGINALLGLNFSYRSFFIQTELKGGFINLRSILTTSSKSDNAYHHFFFVQPNVVIGSAFNIKRKSKRKSKVNS